MGITIYYRGQLKPEASIDDLIEEIKDIAENMEWNYHILDTELPEFDEKIEISDGNLYGIVFAPPQSEPVWLTVLNNRKLAMSVNLNEFNKPYEKVDDINYWCFTKTQYAGPEAHKMIVAILKHISEKYFSFFEVKDEGYYWKSSDENLLYNTFRKYNFLIDSFAAGLENTSRQSGESLEDVIKRLFKNIHGKL